MQAPRFVGRRGRLEELNSHWRKAFHRKQGQIVFLAGEAGIGKTSLVSHLTRIRPFYEVGLQNPKKAVST